MSYLVDVIADRSGKWCHNALRFETCGEAQSYAADLANRWIAVEKTSVVSSTDKVNARFKDRKLEHLHT